MKERLFPSSTEGFTLVELVTAMFVALLIMGATVSAMITGNRNHTVAVGVTDARQNARLALKILERDIRGSGARMFQGISPCGGPVYAPLTMTDLDDYRSAGSILLNQDAYPMTIDVVDDQIVGITVRGGGLGSSTNNAHVYEVKSVSGTSPTLVITLENDSGDPQPNPDWAPGTLLLGCGGDMDAMGGVIYKVQDGSFGAGYTVVCDQFTGGSAEADEANYIRAQPLAVMDVTYLTQEISFQIDRNAKELRMRLNSASPFETILAGITDVRLLTDQGGGVYAPMAVGSTPNAVRVEVDAAAPEDTTVNVSSIVSLRNVP